MAFYLRQLAKYNMDTYIQINIILKGQEYIGVFFLKKIYFSFTRKYIPAEGKIHVYFNPQRFNAQIRKNKIYKRDSEMFSLTMGMGCGYGTITTWIINPSPAPDLRMILLKMAAILHNVYRNKILARVHLCYQKYCSKRNHTRFTLSRP